MLRILTFAWDPKKSRRTIMICLLDITFYSFLAIYYSYVLSTFPPEERSSTKHLYLWDSIFFLTTLMRWICLIGSLYNLSICTAKLDEYFRNTFSPYSTIPPIILNALLGIGYAIRFTPIVNDCGKYSDTQHICIAFKIEATLTIIIAFSLLLVFITVIIIKLKHLMCSCYHFIVFRNKIYKNSALSKLSNGSINIDEAILIDVKNSASDAIIE
jgi:hypothetical protein